MTVDLPNTKLANKKGCIPAGLVDQLCFIPELTFKHPEDFDLWPNSEIRLSDGFQLYPGEDIYHSVIAFVDHGYYEDTVIAVCRRVNKKK